MKINIPVTASSLLKFLSAPRDHTRTRHLGFKQKFPTLLALLVIGLIISFLLIIIISLIEEYLHIDLGNHAIEQIIKENPALTAVFGIIIAPALEELIFRLWITFRRAYILLCIPIWLLQSLNRISKFEAFRTTRRYWNLCYPFIFYFSAIVFGLVHASNFEHYMDYLWFAPLITLPQFILGLIFGYVRVKFGLSYSMLLHAMHNFVLLAPVLIFV